MTSGARWACRCMARLRRQRRRRSSRRKRRLLRLRIRSKPVAFNSEKGNGKVSEGWYKIELTDELRKRPLPDAVFQVQHEFLQRYDTTLNKPNGAVLLANFELNRDNEQVLPSV